jgi:alanyl-tRNA synthetase
LGEHVHQAGQLVSPYECRFDFTHFQALTEEEFSKVEMLINYWIDNSIPVTVREMPIREAKESGAMALFSEKYGDTVRVVSSEYDALHKLNTKEFCGGTHVKITSEILGFKILSENSVASGVRRIMAVTGPVLREYNNNLFNEIQKMASLLNERNIQDTSIAFERFIAKAKANEEIIKNIEREKASDKVGSLIKSAVEKDGIRIITAIIDGVDFDALKKIGDELKSNADIAALLSNGEKLFCICGKTAVEKGYKAGDIVKKAAAITGGKGGGKPDSASAGVGDKTKLKDAINCIFE